MDATPTKHETIKELTARKEAKKQSLKYQRDKDREMVRGKFMFYEVPGGEVTFPFRKYKEDQIETYTFRDGEIYTIPLGVAKHLANDCWYPVHHFQQDENGKPHVKIGQKVHRMGFQSLEFVDIDDWASSGPTAVVSVERA